MKDYIVRRLLYVVVVLVAVAVVGFLIIELPSGDFVTTLIAQLEASGQRVEIEEVERLQKLYGLDSPVYVRFFKWASRLVRGQLGVSLAFNRPVKELILERLPVTIALSIATLLFTYVVAIPIGIYSATRQYSFTDFALTTLGFIGLATPNFLLALVLMFFFFSCCSVSIGGLFSLQYAAADWSLGKVWDLLKHLPTPIIVIGTAGTAGVIRVMRGSVLDELQRQYVITARAKGVGETTLLFRYPVRVALNPIVSTIVWVLPAIVSGEAITAVVLSLPTTGPLLLNALLAQDMYLAATIVVLLTVLTVIGTLLSDIVLVTLDPRIRYERAPGT